jgi:hypothetical protein
MTLDDYKLEFENLFSEFKTVSHVIPSKPVEGFMTAKEFRDKYELIVMKLDDESFIALLKQWENIKHFNVIIQAILSVLSSEKRRRELK